MKNAILICCVVCMSLFYANGDIVKSNIAARKIGLVSEEQKIPLPDGIYPVEYIGSTGTQWIKVGQVIGMTSISVRLAASEIPSSGCFKAFGIGYRINFGDDSGIDSQGRWAGNYNGKYVEIGIFVDVMYDSVARYIDSVLIGGNGFGFVQDAQRGNNLFLFCGTNGTYPYIIGSGNYMAWRGMIASCVVMSDDKKLVDMISVKFINESGFEEGGMYDFVSEQLFRNGGSGEFIIGPDIRR